MAIPENVVLPEDSVHSEVKTSDSEEMQLDREIAELEEKIRCVSLQCKVKTT